MRKTIQALLKRLAACPVQLPWISDGLMRLLGQYDDACVKFGVIRDDLKRIVDD